MGIKNRLFHHSLHKRTVSDIGWELLQSLNGGPQQFESLNLSQEFYSPAISSFFFLHEVYDDRKKPQALSSFISQLSLLTTRNASSVL